MLRNAWENIYVNIRTHSAKKIRANQKRLKVHQEDYIFLGCNSLHVTFGNLKQEFIPSVNVYLCCSYAAQINFMTVCCMCMEPGFHFAICVTLSVSVQNASDVCHYLTNQVI